MSLLCALQSLEGHRIVCSGPPIENLTTLEIHVVTSIPLYDSKIWEIFMHRLPKLKELRVVYVNQGRALNHMFQLTTLSFGRCDGCKEKGLVMDYFVHQTCSSRP